MKYVQSTSPGNSPIFLVVQGKEKIAIYTPKSQNPTRNFFTLEQKLGILFHNHWEPVNPSNTSHRPTKILYCKIWSMMTITRSTTVSISSIQFLQIPSDFKTKFQVHPNKIFNLSSTKIWWLSLNDNFSGINSGLIQKKRFTFDAIKFSKRKLTWLGRLRCSLLLQWFSVIIKLSSFQQHTCAYLLCK